MMTIKSEELFREMDKAGAERRPFLFAVDYEVEEALFIADPLSQTEVLFDIDGIRNCEVPTTAELGDYTFEKHPEPFEVYQERFERAMKALQAGTISVLNLTIKTPITTSLSLCDIFEYSKAKYRLYLPGCFTCFSPERFVRLAEGVISSHPMKGTIDASLPHAMEWLIQSPKELREHEWVVALTKEDLERIATEVEVKRFRYVERVTTNQGEILQSSSEVVGRLPEGYLDCLGTLLSKLLPSGSILGKPRSAAIEVIRDAERQRRGFYSGVAGYFDGAVLETFVLIRFIEEEGGALFYRSGGGVTADSKCESEYEEAIRKVYLPF